MYASGATKQAAPIATPPDTCESAFLANYKEEEENPIHSQQHRYALPAHRASRACLIIVQEIEARCELGGTFVRA